MAGQSSIEWTGSTWNPVRGCSRVSEGCRNCCAENLAARFSGPGNWGEGLATFVTRPDGKREARWTGRVEAAPDHVLTQPLRWKAPRTIFVNSTSDLFHEDLPDDVIDRVFAVMALCPQHTFQVLTKRPERMRAYLSAARAHPVGMEALEATLLAHMADPRSSVGSGITLIGDIAHLKVWPLPNVWLGTSVEDQASADKRIHHLLETPAAVRFISAEPLLGPVDLGRWIGNCYECSMLCGWRSSELDYPPEECGDCELPAGDAETETSPCCNADWQFICPDCGVHAVYSHLDTVCLDWVICGGESGPGARPMHPDWARSLRNQCAAADVPFFFKQWGAWGPGECIPSDMTGWKHDATWFADQWSYDMTKMEDPECKWDDPADLYCVGKGVAGRLLDGVTHDGMPCDGGKP